MLLRSGRRRLIALSTVAAFAAALHAQDAAPFPQGVAVGDVTDTSAVFWTRVEPATPVRLEIAANAAFSNLTLTRDAAPDPNADQTVKLDLAGLTPATTYYYRFIRPDTQQISRVGRFRTAPPPDQAAPLRFVYSGDTNFAFAPFGVMSAAAAEEPDLFIWFGDTIYADVPAGGLGVVTTLPGYRAKHAQVRSDPHVRELLAACAAWTGGDDHEVANDYAGNDPATPPAERDAGYQAFFDYMPIRPQGVAGDQFRTYRRFRWGSQVEFFVLDGRRYRDASAERSCGGNYDPLAFVLPFPFRDAGCEDELSAPRSMLGAEQFDWLTQGLAASTARVKFVINNVPVMFMGFYPYDRWDGYDTERRALLEFIDGHGIEGVVILTSDFHGNLFNPDVTRYFRERRSDYALPGGVRVMEAVVGPLGNETVERTARRFAAALLGDGSLTDFAADFLKAYVANRWRHVAGIEKVELNRVSYALVDVTAEGDVSLALRGTTQAEALGDRPAVETFFDTRAARPATGLPCALFALPGGGLALWAFARAHAPGSCRR